MPAEALGQHGEAVGRGGAADVGEGVQDTRDGRDLVVPSEIGRDAGDEHQVDAVHTAGDDGHQQHRRDGTNAEEQH